MPRSPRMLLDDAIGRTRIEQVAQPTLYLHVTLFLADASHTELGDETFRLIGIEGEEEISTPFEFRLTLRANTENPRRAPLVFKDLLGCRVSFSVARARRAAERSGIVASFAMCEPGVYKLTVRPALW